MKLNLRLLSEVNTGTLYELHKARVLFSQQQSTVKRVLPTLDDGPCPKDMLKRPPNKSDQDRNAVKEGQLTYLLKKSCKKQPVVAMPCRLVLPEQQFISCHYWFYQYS